jgi:sugar fermentation stimulation protein A
LKITEVLKQGEFVKRYKRFFADVLLDGETVVAHVPNTGSLKTCLYPGSECIVSKTTNPERKLKATLHFLKTPTGWVGVNTSLPNFLVYEAWEQGLIEDWKPFAFAQREFKVSKESRLDMVLARDEAAFTARRELHHIEV